MVAYSQIGKFLLRWSLRFAAVAAIAAVAVFFFSPFPEGRLREVTGNGALQVLDAEGNTIGWHVGRDGKWRLQVPLSEVSPYLPAATIAAEDKRFYEHRGVDFLALARAVRQNITHIRRISGASTLTMQVVRLLYPRPRTYITKIRDVLAALQLETLTDKKHIMEVYVNLAPYGGNVIGAQAAALRYFGKNASQLSLGEAALLAGIPQSPSRFNPRKHLQAAMKRREFVFERMVALRFATAEEVARARAEKIVLIDPEITARRMLPGITDWIGVEYPAGGVWKTPIVPAVQKTVTEAANGYFPQLRSAGIDGLAVAVIDVKNAALAAVFTNPAPQDPRYGQLNGITIRRQPGSLLKPFIYAVAYQRGICVPASMVDDSPRAWDGYHPENMDRKYLGTISAAAALRLSRNIPAVELLAFAGRDNVAAALRACGLNIPDTGRLGLSLALGTPELRLLDLTNAYAALARLGDWKAVRLTDVGRKVVENPVGREKSGEGAISPAAAWLALHSLTEDEKPAVVWKTGTSWQHRDAWAIAVSPRYAVGVWAGNWSAVGNERLMGATAALPLAQEIIGRLGRAGETWTRPAGIADVELCAASGLLPGINCRQRCSAAVIAGVSPSVVCHQCGAGNEKRVGEYAAAGAASRDKDAPRLLSPTPGGEYLLAPGAPEKLSLQAEASAGGKITWFIDGAEVARTESGAVYLWKPATGTHTVTAVDSAGRATRGEFKVARAIDN